MKSKNKYKHKRYTNKIKGGAMLAASMASKYGPGLASKFAPGLAQGLGQLAQKEEKDSFLVKMMKYSTKVLSAVVTMLFSLPTRNLDELIPPKECKKYASNEYICSEPLLNTLAFGSKPDHKKILLDNDDCLQYDEKGNKIVSCKITGGYNPFVKDPDDGVIDEAQIEAQDEKNKNEKKKMTKSLFLKAKLEDLNIKLIQINLYLRKYKYPKGKIEELIKKINDKELLQNMLDLCNDLMGKDVIYDETSGYKERGLKCDKDLMDVSKKLELNLDLKVTPDAKHIHFFSKYKNPTRKIKGGAMFVTKALTSNAGQKMGKGVLNFATKTAMSQIPGSTDPSKLAGIASGIAGQFLGSKKSEDLNEETQTKPCETCDDSPMFYVLGKYSSFLSESILGSKNSLDYILINMIREIISIKDDPIGKNIIEILKNIECRSNLRKVIEDHIDSLDTSKENEISKIIKSYLSSCKKALSQIKLATNSLKMPVKLSNVTKSYLSSSKKALSKMKLAKKSLK
jgi:hypothetical protein